MNRPDAIFYVETTATGHRLNVAGINH